MLGRSASVAIDGSKFKAVNNRDKNFTRAKMERRLAQIAESVARYLSQLDTADLAGIGSSTDAFAFLHPVGLHPVFRSVSCHARYTDAGDLALRIEAEEKAGRIAARKVKLYQVECLLPNRAA
jgi:hypothetical protein